MSGKVSVPCWTREEMVDNVISDLADGWHVNLGVGLPTLVSERLPAGREILFQAENGILGIGPAPAPDQVDEWLINASKQPVTLLPGASLCHHADSFAMIRGGHLDLCVLGAFQVAANGDFANWSTGAEEELPAVGGAMDLALGAKRLWVIMQHQTRDGVSRIVDRCTMPLTAAARVSRIYTDFATIDVSPEGLTVTAMCKGLAPDDVRARTDAPLGFAPSVGVTS